jgi:hypothetical protein
MAHERLTVVAIAGHNDGAQMVPSLQQALGQLDGANGLLLSIRKPDSLPSNILWRRIAPLSYVQYSAFVMHSLHLYIKTEFCLIVQDDGWLLNGSRLAEYYAYDYVGAPIHAALVGEHVVELGFRWVRTTDRVVIQNGGFSLRSRKLLQACNTYGYLHKMFSNPSLCNEDVQISGIYRNKLEYFGIKFAPEEHAKLFAVEYLHPDYNRSIDLSLLVGIHGPTRRLVGHKHVRADMNSYHYYGEDKILQHLQSQGYTIEYVANSIAETTVVA